MQSFIPVLSPTNVRMLSPSRRGHENIDPLEDGAIEIPDSAGLSDETRNAIYNVWAHEDEFDGDSGFVDGMHPLSVYTPFISYLI
jgi:hypothetical protein